MTSNFIRINNLDGFTDFQTCQCNESAVALGKIAIFKLNENDITLTPAKPKMSNKVDSYV